MSPIFRIAKGDLRFVKKGRILAPLGPAAGPSTGRANMGHALEQLGPNAFAVRYSGTVPYTERCEALDLVSAAFDPGSGQRRLLIDFSDATPIEENAGHRVDFIARVVALPNLDDCNVAIVGDLCKEHLHPISLGCAMRGLRLRLFKDETRALSWLGMLHAA